MNQDRMVDYVLNDRREIKASIDKLTILADDTGNFDRMVNENHYGYMKAPTLAKHPYKKNFHCVDGAILQWTNEHKFQAVRFEFNPNNIRGTDKENNHMAAVADILGSLKNPNVSRMDVAYDFIGYDFNRHKIIDNLGVKKNYWVDANNALETLYVGAPGSDIRIRIYDKAKEQKVKVKGFKWWRVELQLRGDACKPLQGKIWDENSKTLMRIVPGFVNLNGIKIVLPSLKQIEKVQERAMVKLLLEEPETMAELGKQAKAKYKKILSSLPTEQEIDLDSVHNDNQSKIMHELQRYLQFSERNNFENNVRRSDKRSQEELDNTPVDHDSYTKDDEKFLIESAKAHLLYNE